MACLVANRSPLKENMANRSKPFVMEIAFDGAKKTTNLQEAFEKFRKDRQREMKVAKAMEEKARHTQQDATNMEALRMKFLEGVKKYFGVPYAKRYHELGSPYYDSPLFLDCCGLIRRVLLDLKEDFGFVVGAGNQAYMYDTLPIDIEREEDMKPGDLVFITATYYTNTGKKWKQQRHDLVHVEVWLGDGEKTIGARWQKGVVQVFDSYKFVSKSYHNMKYHFKSIDTWLMGICKSFCPEHSWRRSQYNPGNKSVFALDDGQEDDPCEAAEEQEETGSSSSDAQQQETCAEEKVQTGVENALESLPGHSDTTVFALDDGQEDDPCEAAEEQEEISSSSDAQQKGICPEEKVQTDGENECLESIPGHNSGTICAEGLCTAGDLKKDCKNVHNVVQESTKEGCEEDRRKKDVHRDGDFNVIDGISLENKIIRATRDDHSSNEEGFEEDASNTSIGCFQLDENSEQCLNELSDRTFNSFECQNCAERFRNDENTIHKCRDPLVSGLECRNDASLGLRSVYENVDSTILQISNCQCPECVQLPRYCVHSRISSQNEEEEGYWHRLSECSELSSSLECFEVIGSTDCTREVDSAIVSCPISKTTSKIYGGSGSGSPTKEKGSNGGSGGSPPGDENNKKGKDNDPRPRRDEAKSRLSTSTCQPTFYVSNGNGSSMVDCTLVSLGWRRLEDKNDYSFKLKWVECKSQLDYNNFREGEQLVNHISNIGLLTTKLGLLSSLQEYERVLDKVGSKQRITLSEFVPETYALTNTTEKQKFVQEIYKEGEIWICKPIGQNQGKGIYIVNNTAQLQDKLKLNQQADSRRASHVRPPQGRVIQRYITNPLLLNGFKFDVRTYMFIASTRPYVILYHPGYIRVSCVPYSPYSQDSSTELHAHLTNQYVQKKHPLYSSMKEETVWSFGRIQAYIDEHHAKDKQLADNWMFTTFTKRMQQIMLTCFHSVRKKLHRRHGYFDLLGFDFMIDENFKVWLLEINVNPSLSTSCQVLKEVIPDMVDSTLKIALEIFEKTKKKKPIFPIENIGGFQVLYNGEGKG